MARTPLAKPKPKILTVSKPSAKPAPGKSPTGVSASEREAMIREAAYFKAAQSGFNGDCMAHWLEAEQEIDRKLKGR